MEQVLNRFSLHELDNETHVALIQDGCDLVKTSGPGSIGVTDLFNNHLLPAKEAEEDALDIILMSNFTPQIKAADAIRDDISSGLAALVKVFLRHPDVAKRAAAEVLDRLISHYGNLRRKGYSKQSAATIDMLRELDLPANKALLALLGATDWVEQLRAANNTVVDLLRARDAEIAKRPGARMRDLRVETDKALTALLDRVEAQITLYGLTSASSDYAPFMHDYNALAERYKHTLAVARGRRAAAAAKEEGEEL
jgi:hypothetical protein